MHVRVVHVVGAVDGEPSLLRPVQLPTCSVPHSYCRYRLISSASLVSARTTANSIYCPPKLQAALDLQSGVFISGADVLHV